MAHVETSVLHVFRIGEPLLNRTSPLRGPLLNHNGHRWELRFNLYILVQKPLFYRSVEAREHLFDRFVLVRERVMVEQRFPSSPMVVEQMFSHGHLVVDQGLSHGFMAAPHQG